MGHLIVRRGPDRGAIYQLEDEQITVGRGNKNTIIIRDNEISREHLLLVRTDKGYELHDLGSSNGTFINGLRVEDAWLLESQCIIELGDSVTLEFRPGDPYSEAHAQAQPAQPAKGAQLSYLVVLRTGSQTEPAVYPLDRATMVVGRSTECDIVIVEPEMSREHFFIALTDRGYHIQDKDSTNGTILNGEKLVHQEVQLLKPGDVIQVGELIFFQFTNSPEKFASDVPTDIITTHDATVLTRKTSPSGVPSVLRGMSDATDSGVRSNGSALQNQVLVTYAREDWGRIVAPLVDKLGQDDIGAWVDQYLLEGSDDWVRATEQARLECWLLVVIVSPAAMESDWVKTNWRHFHNREKPIILVIYEPVDQPLPVGAKSLTRIDYNPALPEVAFQQLADEIRRLRK